MLWEAEEDLYVTVTVTVTYICNTKKNCIYDKMQYAYKTYISFSKLHIN